MSITSLFDCRIKKYAYKDIDSIYKELNISNYGLNNMDVEAMKEWYGENRFLNQKKDTTLYRLRKAFVNPFHVILFVLGIISFITDVLFASNFSRNFTTSTLIFVMILISGTIRLIKELRAKNASLQLD